MLVRESSVLTILTTSQQILLYIYIGLGKRYGHSSEHSGTIIMMSGPIVLLCKQRNIGRHLKMNFKGIFHTHYFCASYLRPWQRIQGTLGVFLE